MTISLTPVSTNLYTTVATLKTRLGISDTTDDTTLGLVLSGVCRAIDGHCGQSFFRDAAASVRYYTATDKGVVFTHPIVSVTTLATDSNADRTYATAWADTDFDLLPDNAAARSWPYTYIETAPGGNYSFPTVAKGVKLTAIFGWPSVPSAVSEAALLWGERLFKRKDTPWGIAAFADVGEVRILQDMDPDVVTLLKPFVRLF